MIRVTVELVPFGDDSKAKVIGRILIANTGVGNATTGYYASITEYNTDRGAYISKAEVTDFSRKEGVWSLIHKVLTADQCNESDKLIFERLKKRLV